MTVRVRLEILRGKISRGVYPGQSRSEVHSISKSPGASAALVVVAVVSPTTVTQGEDPEASN